ncbi:MAG TPA: hypothetical protein PKM50_03950 [Methanoregula sp.]|nr:hypothetical protein [Methanoregula sp.]
MKMKGHIRKFLVIAIFMIVFAMIATPVSAELKISLTVFDTSNPNGAGNFYSKVFKDSDDGSTDGVITLPNGFQPIANLKVEGSTHTSVHANPSILASGSSRVANNRTTPVRIYAAVSDTDYDPPAHFADITASGTFTNAVGSTIDEAWFNDPANAQGADKAFSDYADFNANKASLTPGNQVDSYSYTATSVLKSFNYNKEKISVDDPNKYSMTLVFDYTLQPGTTYESALTSRGQGMTKYIPEFPSYAVPAGMVVGLIGVALFIRRKKE